MTDSPDDFARDRDNFRKLAQEAMRDGEQATDPNECERLREVAQEYVVLAARAHVAHLGKDDDQ